MKKKLWDLRAVDFTPLSEAKAKLSALVRRLVPGEKTIVITNNGRPAAVLMAYEDYLAIGVEAGRAFTLKEWEQGGKQRQRVLTAVSNLFNVDALSRKGQKAYKAKVLRDFDR